ncbi:hypothetical protein N7532_007803 [Penicillium argentinense]|uniref:Uncharacterized protein n=1 Tax=Penicillium argentinense TaxID=1131581 RepID=A0A9W9EWC4_9EURO|nr:uncharacterized protein N7532_007803 [Penicillium argentinense]KAJ5089119.1 hypothetical protein N7532_007803 [Penicillium argentinense]
MAVTDSIQNVNGAGNPRRMLLISVPRTASNLLMKILNIHEQPQFHTSQKGGYFFYPAFVSTAQSGYLGKPAEQWSQDDKTSVKSAFQGCLDALENESALAQKDGKAMFAKEHAFWFFNPAALDKMRTGTGDPEFFKAFHMDISDSYGPSRSYSAHNETILPDEYMCSWQFAFIIRHPALAWPSMYRAMKKVADSGFLDEDGVKGSSLTNMTMRWTRMLYEWCLEQPDVPVAPPLVDAHDLIHNPEIVYKLCEQTGLDKSVLQFEWNNNGEPKRSDSWEAPSNANAEEPDIQRQTASIFLSTLEESKGIVKDKAPATIDIDTEAAKWKAEFGEEIAGLIEERVRDSMPDYEFLKARRITL